MNQYVKYALNKRNRKLHAITCKRVKDTFSYIAENSLNALLDETEGKISCCKICLKNDEKAQTLVEAHNQKIKKSA